MQALHFAFLTRQEAVAWSHVNHLMSVGWRWPIRLNLVWTSNQLEVQWLFTSGLISSLSARHIPEKLATKWNISVEHLGHVHRRAQRTRHDYQVQRLAILYRCSCHGSQTNPRPSTAPRRYRSCDSPSGRAESQA